VINKQGEISDATRRHVEAIIAELGYRPNALARGLVSGKTLSIGLIIPQITDPFFPEVVLGVESVAHARGYSVFLCNTNESPQQELDYVDTLAGKQVDGVILCGSRLNAQQIEQVAARHRVAILTSRMPRGTATISIPGEEGLHLLTTHLIELGHQAIGHLGWRDDDQQDRLDGYCRALTDGGIAADSNRIVLMPRVGVEEGRVATEQLLEQAPDITAITCYNDLAAIGALQTCAKLGRRVPDDISIVGFDDIPQASQVTPRLTTMHVPRHTLGEMVMDLLLKVIASKGSHEEHVYVQPELIIRESSGPQPRTQRM
jgi:LacI family transcriptional regulator